MFSPTSSPRPPSAKRPGRDSAATSAHTRAGAGPPGARSRASQPATSAMAVAASTTASRLSYVVQGVAQGTA
jgi:hypothetical protein